MTRPAESIPGLGGTAQRRGRRYRIAVVFSLFGRRPRGYKDRESFGISQEDLDSIGDVEFE